MRNVHKHGNRGKKSKSETAECKHLLVGEIFSDIQRAERRALKLRGALETLVIDLAQVGDDAELANVDLQNILQKAQQSLQMLSNISKMLHDEAMAIIRKIGG